MKAGSSLVEVVVALLLVSVSSLAAVGLLHETARTVRGAESRERLLWLTADLVDSLAAARVTGEGERSAPDGSRVRWRLSDAAGWVESLLPGDTAVWIAVPVMWSPEVVR